MKEYSLTREGIAELEAEAVKLEAQKPGLAERIRLAREQGDLRENADYQIAKDELARVESRLQEVKHIISNADIIEEQGQGDAVRLGSKVSLKDGDGEDLSYKIVGSMEADPLNGKISDSSPIGQALMGKSQGDKVKIKTANGTVDYTVTSIS